MRFRDGLVRPGEQVMFRLLITDNAPKAEFYLVQQREQHIVLGPRARRPGGGGPL
jgi:hypothetical protein